ncbi:MAG: hypothetical protein CMA31_04650 [Euryarchaeota archaeon]|nr:hypothetical protein [Euryarchaeota archaeon]RPG71364.1 MAG: alpha/beta fold hydrolase [Euryarchaeota archaeon TMED192]RPG71913.1 MAG: alpha/beta fold hydrolase [Euryarchaeota archaeon TMED192]|tara:strand:- start:1313 stop:1897 length:585 start_codon:yes stop_codon:yes gene_type:complete
MATTNNLVMLHGMTGTSVKMRPLAESLAPNNWGIVCPEGTYVHPRSGRAWWVREEIIDAVTPANQILMSMKGLEQSLPEGKMIIGGFSQGGAIASAMLETSIEERIVGLVLLATMTVRGEQLQKILRSIRPRTVVWMHGERDHIVNIDDGLKLATIFKDAGWKVIQLRHGKGHMVDLSQKGSLVDAIRMMSEED